MSISVPTILAQHINSTSVANLSYQLDLQSTMLTEAEKAEGAEELVDYIKSAVASTEQRIQLLESSMVTLEKAVRAFDEVHRICERAVALYAAGSEDAKTALKLRDEAEIAHSRERVASRRLHEAKVAVPHLPITGSHGFNQEDLLAAKGMVDSMSAICANRVFRPYSAMVEIRDEIWDRWKMLSNEIMRWLPLFVERTCREYDALVKKYEGEDVPERDSYTGSPEDVRAMYRKLLDERATAKSTKLHTAKLHLVRVEQEVSR